MLVYWLNLRPCPARASKAAGSLRGGPGPCPCVARSLPLHSREVLRGLRKAGCDLRRLSPSGAAACGLLCAPCLVACCSLSHSKRLRPCSIANAVRSKASTAPPKRMRQALCSLSCAELVWSAALVGSSAAGKTIFARKGSFSLPWIAFPRKKKSMICGRGKEGRALVLPRRKSALYASHPQRCCPALRKQSLCQ